MFYFDTFLWKRLPSFRCPHERGEGLVHGGRLECATFPRVA